MRGQEDGMTTKVAAACPHRRTGACGACFWEQHNRAERYRKALQELRAEYTGTPDRAKEYRWSLTRIAFALQEEVAHG